MNSIRRTAVRALLGLAAALLVGLVGATTADAQSVDTSMAASTVQTGDIIW